MKVLLGVSSLCLAAGVVGASMVQPARLDPDNIPGTLCPGYEGVFTKAKLSQQCGYDENNACAVFTKKKADEASPRAECGEMVGIQTMVDRMGDAVYIHGVIAGYLDDMNLADTELALEYGGYTYACPYPCFGEAENDTLIHCAATAGECPESHAPAMRTVTSQGILVSHLVELPSISMHYKFEDSTKSEIEDNNPGSIVNELNIRDYEWGAIMWEIKQGDQPACVAESDKWEFTPEEAYISGGCGVSGEVPCPIIQGEKLGGVCYDPSSPQCYDVTFWTEGLHDPNAKYCTAEDSCASFYHTRRFKVVETENGVYLPISVWRDVCPFECADDQQLGTGVCVASASHCKDSSVMPDTQPIAPEPLPTDPWDYTVPGSKDSMVHVVSSVAVECDAAHASTEAPEETSGETSEGTSEGTSAAHRGVVGSLTVFLVACGVVYNV